jgi:hypothetical protein
MAFLYDNYKNYEPNSPRVQVRAEVLKERFLELYATCGNVQATCRILGMVPRTLYHWRKNDKKFAEDFTIAEYVSAFALEDEAWRRGHDGWDEPVYQQGMKVGVVRRFSDGLLKQLLQAKMPDKYRQNIHQEIGGPGGVPLQITHVHSDKALANTEEEIIEQLRIEGKTIDTEPISVDTVSKTPDFAAPPPSSNDDYDLDLLEE